MNNDCEVNVISPILPGVGIGIFTLKNHIKNYYDILKYYTVDKLDPYCEDDRKYAFLRSPFQMVFCIADCVHVVFHTMNGKLIEVTVLNGYKGCFNNRIYVGMPLSKFIELEPEFICDVAEGIECYKHPQIKGISINRFLFQNC